MVFTITVIAYLSLSALALGLIEDLRSGRV